MDGRMGQQKSHQRPAMEPDPFISPGGGTIGESTTARPDRKSGSEFRLRARRGRDYTTTRGLGKSTIFVTRTQKPRKSPMAPVSNHRSPGLAQHRESGFDDLCPDPAFASAPAHNRPITKVEAPCYSALAVSLSAEPLSLLLFRPQGDNQPRFRIRSARQTA